MSAMLTMRNWMFIKQYADLREHLLRASSAFEFLVIFDRGVRRDTRRKWLASVLQRFCEPSHEAFQISHCR